MRRIRSKLTYANVMATLAVFLVLGGGSAVALSGSNTVQSDDLGPGAQVKAADVAANAVGGGKIIDGSVGGADLANNAVNGAKVLDNSVTGADVNESTLGGLIHGQMIDANIDSANGPDTLIATVGPYRITGKCSPLAGTTFRIDAEGPAGSAEAEYTQVRNDGTDLGSDSFGSQLSANVDTVLMSFSESGGFRRVGGTLVLRSNTGTIVQVTFSIVLDDHATACHLWGTATTG